MEGGKPEKVKGSDDPGATKVGALVQILDLRYSVGAWRVGAMCEALSGEMSVGDGHTG